LCDTPKMILVLPFHDHSVLVPICDRVKRQIHAVTVESQQGMNSTEEEHKQKDVTRDLNL
jgi:hypothetical protein